MTIQESSVPLYLRPSQLQKDLEESGHNITARRISQMCIEGKIDAVKSAGGHWRIPEAEYQRVLAERGGTPSRVKPNVKRKSLDRDKGYLRSIKRYGLTPERYQQIHDEQDGRCAICKCNPKRKYARFAPNQQRLVVDHWHDDTHAVRGLLCSHCNFGIGRWLDNPTLLKAAIRYLNKHLPLRLDQEAS